MPEQRFEALYGDAISILRKDFEALFKICLINYTSVIAGNGQKFGVFNDPALREINVLNFNLIRNSLMSNGTQELEHLI